jgi:hypothetical protein
VFKNLNAEQARRDMSNTKVADILGLSRISYENKKKTGKFTLPEIRALLELFGGTFEYLFEMTEDRDGN